jgi:hypothetical protein
VRRASSTGSASTTKRDADPRLQRFSKHPPMLLVEFPAPLDLEESLQTAAFMRRMTDGARTRDLL